jgi:hypothetical protein
LQVGKVGLLFFTDQAVDALVIGVKGVGAELEMGEQENGEADGQAEGKSQYIDKRIGFVPGDVAPGHFEVVFQHSGSFAVMVVITSR